MMRAASNVLLACALAIVLSDCRRLEALDGHDVTHGACLLPGLSSSGDAGGRGDRAASSGAPLEVESRQLRLRSL